MVRARRVSENCFTAMNLGVRARYCGCQGRHHPWFLRGHARTEPTPAGVWERSESVNYVQGLGGKQVCQGQRGGPEPAADSRYFFTVHVIVFSSQVPAALSQSALVFGASCAKAGAETANRRPAMSAKLTVFICVSSYLLEHLNARRQNASLGWAFRVQTFTSAPFLFAVCCACRMAETFCERYPPSCV